MQAVTTSVTVPGAAEGDLVITLERVLVAMDFSDTGGAALSQGRAIAEAFGATLHVLSVVTEPVDAVWAGYTPGVAFCTTVDHLQAQRRARLARLFSEDELSTGRVVLATTWGEASDAIVDYAVVYDIGLVVCGTHGRCGMSRLAVGSVAEHVVRRARCPVLTVHADPALTPAA